MKTRSRLNAPLASLSESQLATVVVVLGIFALKCQTKLKKKTGVLGILLYYLKMYDMNLLRIQKSSRGYYTVKTTPISAIVVQHLVTSGPTSEFLPKKIVTLASNFNTFASRDTELQNL